MASSTAEAGRRDGDEDIANLSIREICRRFQGERLIVQPLEWTARHLQLLRCTINELPESSRNPSQLQPMPNTPQPSPEVATNWARTVVTRYPHEVARAVGSLLEFFSITKLSEYLLFYYEKHEIPVPCDVYTGISPCSNGPRLSSVAFVNALDIHHLRREILPHRLLCRLPQHDDKKAAFTDPYIAAILIAQAQRLRKENAHSDRTTDPGVKSSKTHLQYKVQLLKSVQMGIRRKQLCLYTAFVTDAFLDKLAYPSQRSESHLDIWYRGIESEPYETFPRRVIEAMHHNPRGEKRRGGDDELENQDGKRCAGGPQSCTAKR